MAINPAEQINPWHPVVARLLLLLEDDIELNSNLVNALKLSARFEEPLLDSYCYLIHRMQTTIPNPQTWLPMNLEFYYVIACADNNYLGKHIGFMDWVRYYVESIGSWMDSPESIDQLQMFYDDKYFKIDDYVAPPGGWKTYNQFFARQIKSGARPIDEPSNNKVIVSAADSSFCGCHQISPESSVKAKGLNWYISDLLEDSPHANEFTNGWYCHSFLAPTNYHRFHTPVAGKLIELRNITGKVTMDVHLDPKGNLSVLRGAIGYQFKQERGLAVIESAIGLVAIIPIGMGIVSSVSFSALNNSILSKGSELGFFSFGGSDVVLLFQKGAAIDWLVKEGDTIQQGQSIAFANC